MKRILLACAAAGAAFSPATAALADTGPSQAQIYEAGHCMVVSDRRTTVSFLLSLPIDDGDADLTRLPSGLQRRCAPGLSSANALHLRGAIAQALFLRDFRDFGLQPQRSIPLVNLNIPVQSSPPGTGMTELYRWADCVVRNDNAHAEQLMSSRVGSPNEARAIDGLRAFMTACAPEGQQLAVRPSDFRSLIAQSSYNSMYRYWTGQLAPVNDQ
jgi:hypothetical protein